MRYKTLFYNVEPIAKRLPDDCLKIVISYAYDDSAYNSVQQFLTRYQIKIFKYLNLEYYHVYLFNSKCQIMYTIEKWNVSCEDDVICHSRPYLPEITFELLTNTIYNDGTSLNKDNDWYFDSDNIFRYIKKLKTDA